jgi:hypothetical protein
MFLYTAALKMVGYRHARHWLQPYRILPPRLATAVGFLLPWIEGLTGILLLLEAAFPIGSLMGIGLGLVFTYVSVKILWEKRVVPCGCGGITGELVGSITLARAIAIVIAGLLILRLDQPGTSPLPFPLYSLIIGLSLAPAGWRLRQAWQAHQQRRQHIEHLRVDQDRLRKILMTPLPTWAHQERSPDATG